MMTATMRAMMRAMMNEGCDKGYDEGYDEGYDKVFGGLCLRITWLPRYVLQYKKTLLLEVDFGHREISVRYLHGAFFLPDRAHSRRRQV